MRQGQGWPREAVELSSASVWGLEIYSDQALKPAPVSEIPTTMGRGENMKHHEGDSIVFVLIMPAIDSSS